MKWILNQNQKYKVPYILLNILLIFFDSIGIIIPILIGYMVDSITISGNYHKLLLLAIGLIALAIFKTVGAYLTVIRLDLVSFKITSEIKQKCYQKLNNLDYNFFLHNNKGELMTNFTSDINDIRRHISFNIKTIGAIIITFLWALIYLLKINVPFTLILLTPGILVAIFSYRFVKKIEPKYDKARNMLADVNDFISDNIEANRVVKTFAMEKSEIKKMQDKNGKLTNQYIENCLLEDDFYYVEVPFLSHLMSVIFLIGGGLLFIKGKITMGELIIFNSYLGTLRAPFIRLSGLLNNVERYVLAKKRIEKLLNATPLINLNGTKPLTSLKVPIEFKNVRIVYDNKVVLENLNLTINPNETIAFIGKTGSGKSSIANMLLGFITPESGEILINNENYLNYNIKDIRRLIGYVTQNAFLFSDSIYENIRYGNEEVNKDEALNYAHIACANYVDKLDKGIETVIGEKGVDLSGGEKQRLSLARALAVKPDLLLLDDITSALDIDTEAKINESINSLDYKATKIIIASKIVSVKNADKILVLDNGKVMEMGTHKELLDKKGYYYELYCISKGGEA